MVNWLLIGLVIVAMIVVSKFIHFKHLKHRITAILLILVLVFAYTTFTTIVKSNNIDLKSATGVYSAIKAYGSWFGLAFNNMKALTGNVVKMDWFPSNYSRSSEVDLKSNSINSEDIEYA
jgi:hypothetical protein